MIELEGRLFDPPGDDVVAVVLPTSCDGIFKYGHERRATKRWPGIDDLVRRAFKHFGSRTVPLTYRDDAGAICFQGGVYLNARWHLVVLPVRRYAEAPMDMDIIINNIRGLTKLANTAPPLATGQIVLPTLDDDPDRAGAKPLTWARIKPMIEPYLADDRYVALANAP